MNEIELNYRTAADAYQAQQPTYLSAGRRRRTQMISDRDYLSACNAYVDLRRTLDQAEAVWIASWR
jgi:hypothetical protein